MTEVIKNFLIPTPEVRRARGGRSRSSHHRDIKLGRWTIPIHIGPHSTATPLHELEALNAAYIAGKSDDDIKALVARLHAQRHEGGVNE